MTVESSTTDFFRPMVDDPRDFGRITATNAIADIYAMGRRSNQGSSPSSAMPIDRYAEVVAASSPEGGREALAAVFPIASRHSINSPEPACAACSTVIA